MKYSLLFLLFLIGFACEQVKEDSDSSKAETEFSNKSVEPVYTVITEEDAVLGWGYQILKDGKMVIIQKHIPAIQGKKGFNSKEDAEKTAYLTIDKIKKGSFPPTVSIEELDSLGVI